jgi:hypothetical protein
VKLPAPPARKKNVEEEQHNTTLAVWDVASPVVIYRFARIKVGAKCSAGCRLTGEQIELRDEAGRTIARAVLGDAAWPGTSGLYWTELEFVAPPPAATHSWILSSEHGDARSEFAFITVDPPEHSLTIRARDKNSQTPVAGVEVRLGVYRASSDDRGVATLELPRGSYTLNAWKLGYEQFSIAVDVTNNLAIDIELAIEHEPAQPYWM